MVCLQAVNALPAPCHPTLLPHPPLALTDGYCPAREGLCPLSSPETPSCGQVSSEGTRFVCGPAVLCGGGLGTSQAPGTPTSARAGCQLRVAASLGAQVCYAQDISSACLASQIRFLAGERYCSVLRNSFLPFTW